MFERSLYTFVVAFVHLRSDIWEVFSILTYLLKQLLRKSSFNLMFYTLCTLIQLIKSNIDPSFNMSFSILIYDLIIFPISKLISDYFSTYWVCNISILIYDWTMGFATLSSISKLILWFFKTDWNCNIIFKSSRALKDNIPILIQRVGVS